MYIFFKTIFYYDFDVANTGVPMRVLQGRNGLGSLYVFAAGNGGIFGDHCGADGYVNSIYSIAVASATHDGDLPFYAERCPAVIATAYSGSAADEVKIVGYNSLNYAPKL